MTLISKVRAISGSSTETSDAQVVNFLTAGATFLINSIPTGLLAHMATSSSNISGSSGYDITTEKVFSVTRGGIECDQLPQDQTYAHNDIVTATSIHKGSTVFPKYFIRNGKVFIKPDPTVGQPGIIYEVKRPSITTSTTTTVLDQLENPMLNYAAALDLMSLSGYWADTAIGKALLTGSDYQDAMDKARNLVDNSTALSNGQDAEYYSNDEDVEMITGVLNIAGQEINRALAAIKSAEDGASSVGSYIQRASFLFELAFKEVNQYIQNNEKMIALSFASRGAQQ